MLLGMQYWKNWSGNAYVVQFWAYISTFVKITNEAHNTQPIFLKHFHCETDGCALFYLLNFEAQNVEPSWHKRREKRKYHLYVVVGLLLTRQSCEKCPTWLINLKISTASRKSWHSHEHPVQKRQSRWYRLARISGHVTLGQICDNVLIMS
jgi:hypothetical protein